MVVDGQGGELLCSVRSAARRGVTLEVLARRLRPHAPCRMSLFQGVPKTKAMDLIVQKATELGAQRIVPLLAERSAVHLTGNSVVAKAEKWRAQVIEAAKQCGAAWFTQIEAPLTVTESLARNERCDLALLASLESDSRHPRQRLQTYLAEHGRPPATIGVWVGPEGDFAPAERQMIVAGGALPVSLGDLVLRSDTAAIYCLSVLNYELQALALGLS